MTELYSIITNCDESILLLNSVINKKGFEFIRIPVPDLEKHYKFLFNLPEKYTSSGTIGYPNGVVSDTFFNIFQSSQFIDNWEREYIIALKSNIGDIPIQEDDWFGFKRFNYIESFTNQLLDNLRLFSEGDIEVGCFFSFDRENMNGILYPIKRSLFTDNIYKINETQIERFSNEYLDLKIENTLAKKIKMYFDQSFRLNQEEIRYILLVTALESALNNSTEQISHTFSRHLAMIISKDRINFQENYKKIKKLYNFRSEIVHGLEYKKELLNENIIKLRDYVRKTIFYINKHTFGQNKELFEYLNGMGYE